jgi:GTP-binding protein YchF
MNLSVGIVGLPNVGKSTLFNALTQKSVPAENYPFCTIDPAVGVVPVPDSRLDTLAELSGSQERVPAVVEFVDIAGLVKGASAGEGLGNQFLSNIREVDLIAEVVRVFEDDDMHHVSGVVDPYADIEVINLELIMADAQTVAKRFESVQKDVKRGDKEAVATADLCNRLMQHLESGKLARHMEMSELDVQLVTQLHLLTMKPIMYICNKKHGAFNFDEQNDERWQELHTFFTENDVSYEVVDAGVEHELRDLSSTEKNEFRREYGSQDSGVDSLIRASYDHLGLMSYFTTGAKETRAWTVRKGSTAPEAGAAIHSDFQTKFIRAQVVSFPDLVAAGSWPAARDAGTLRTEGKEYIVEDGDVIEFMI